MECVPEAHYLINPIQAQRSVGLGESYHTHGVSEIRYSVIL